MANFDENDGFEYLIVRPEKGGTVDLVRYMLWGDLSSGVRFLESSSEEYLAEQLVFGDYAADNRWILVVSILVRKIIALLRKPMEYTGYAVEFILNLLSLNANLSGLIYNLFHGKVVIPQRGTDTFISTIGHLDGRIDLYSGQKIAEDMHNSDLVERGLKIELGNRVLMDLCMMASKCISWASTTAGMENSVHSVVLEYYSTDFQKERSTQVFILCDKPKDATLILISFRGTEPFDADDWMTDFDYSWYEFPKLGKVHMGFLEALGLGNRENAITFQHHLQMKNTNFNPSNRDDVITNSAEGTKSIPSNTASDSKKQSSTGNRKVLPELGEMSAYHVVKEKLKDLLKEHKNAKFVVTGHSLGGALAILLPTILVVHEEEEVMQRLLGVYTFGQPRVGNRQLGRFIEAHLDSPVRKYFRVVYCNDMVPRLPYDDKTFLYKHFGMCLYYNSCYIEQLIRSLTMGHMYGPEYVEGWFSILSRIMGLVLPGVSAHCPTDYVNSMRLGRSALFRCPLSKELLTNCLYSSTKFLFFLILVSKSSLDIA
ncbi:hypothetical protein JRO89_XS09G0238000 [Xanthoceras sorbifolium]|uniref:Fungal lipase-type domain-containing protein n=1 Tax=Xanthoceras sorbifolium TaxID=99658 RepID=A0ABQ8HMR9_9ROSI|nr:hypothetical protein JRO89_XS09G0238000 [Xanthoceras sorbifolium]